MNYIVVVCLNALLSLGLLQGTQPFNVHNLEFNTSYNQFYIGDKEFKGNTGSSTFWSTEAYHDRLAIDNDVLGIGTGSYGHIKTEIAILDKENVSTDFSKYDHVVEGSVSINSGMLDVTDCPNNKVQLELKVSPGTYRVRVYSIDLAKADHDLYTGKDSYKIEVWPAKASGRKVLKRYNR